jgi:hypothetical protein
VGREVAGAYPSGHVDLTRAGKGVTREGEDSVARYLLQAHSFKGEHQIADHVASLDLARCARILDPSPQRPRTMSVHSGVEAGRLLQRVLRSGSRRSFEDFEDAVRR